jgi:hypothetical protein
MKKRAKYGLSLFCLLLCWQERAHAEGSRIVINPKILTGTEYSTNFWKAEDNAIAVSTYYVKPGLSLGYETAKSKVEAELSVDGYWYDDHGTRQSGTRNSADDNYLGFTGAGTFSHQTTDRLKLGIDDSILFTRNPASADPLSNSVSREKFTTNRLTPNLFYDFGNKFSAEVRYRNTLIAYAENLGGEDSSEHRALAYLTYYLNRSAAVYLNYQVWQRDYDATTFEYISNQVTLNYSHSFNFFTFAGGAGYHIRTFEGSGSEDIDMFTWDLSVKGEEKASGKKSRYSMLASIGQSINDEGSGEQYYITTNARLEGKYLFLGKIGTGARIEYQNSEYQNDPKNREDDTLTTAAKLTYSPVDSLTFGLEAGVKDRDSSIDGNSYDDEFVIATIDFNYILGSKN